LAAAYSYFGVTRTFAQGAQGQSLLEGKITSSGGAAVAAIPVRAHRDNSNMTVSVYTNSRGEYSFPAWSDLTPGTYSVAIQLPDFERVTRDGVALAAGKTTRLDLSLQPRQPTLADATASDIVAALPGTDEQKHLFIQCDNCHSLQWALKNPHTREEWGQIVRKMAGRRGNLEKPGTKSFGQKQYLDPLADYLTSIRGPGSSDQIPFRLRPRPTAEASTRIVVTEYEIPRGGQHDIYTIRRDLRYAWPHDIIMDENYAYYTDHYSPYFGRLNKKTGEVKEYRYAMPQRAGREGAAEGGMGEGGTHDIMWDSQHRVVFGMGGATLRFDPKTEQFTSWPSGGGMFGMDPQDGVWSVRDEGELSRLDTKTGAVKEYKLPAVDGIYDHEVDSKGRSIINVWDEGKFRLFDPKTEKFTDHPTPTPQSGPRRGDMDSHDRQWVGLYWAGRLAVFDPNKGETKEFALVPDSKPFGPPFPAPYSAAVDDKNQFVWTSDFNSSRIYRFDMKTEKTTEYFTPLPYEVRDLTVDKTASRPTVWIPAYRPPSKMVKIQMY
jgi:streptogramin lyase